MAVAREEHESDSLASLEERVTRAVELVAALRQERDQLAQKLSSSEAEASRLAADRFGGFSGRPPRAVERTHDIHMARVYLLYRLRQPELLQHWVFEEQVKSERRRARQQSGPSDKLPDVLLRTGSGTMAVEFGGAYGKDKVTAFHGYCKEHSISYELW